MTTVQHILLFCLLTFGLLFPDSLYPTIIYTLSSDTVDLESDNDFKLANEKLLAGLDKKVLRLQRLFTVKDNGYLTFSITIDKSGNILEYETLVNGLDDRTYENRISESIQSWNFRNKSRKIFTIIHKIDLSDNPISPISAGIRDELKKSMLAILIASASIFSMFIIPIIRNPN